LLLKIVENLLKALKTTPKIIVFNNENGKKACFKGKTAPV